mmetsp:Transcript_40374/g.121656  ORF Transcript_40374/g.121656 Transcript_40374/m.121656 type:complete len:244 (-) Transcript_40374:956-1687(-)
MRVLGSKLDLLGVAEAEGGEGDVVGKRARNMALVLTKEQSRSQGNPQQWESSRCRVIACFIIHHHPHQWLLHHPNLPRTRVCLVYHNILNPLALNQLHHRRHSFIRRSHYIKRRRASLAEIPRQVLQREMAVLRKHRPFSPLLPHCLRQTAKLVLLTRRCVSSLLDYHRFNLLPLLSHLSNRFKQLQDQGLLNYCIAPYPCRPSNKACVVSILVLQNLLIWRFLSQPRPQFQLLVLLENILLR